MDVLLDGLEDRVRLQIVMWINRHAHAICLCVWNRLRIEGASSVEMRKRPAVLCVYARGFVEYDIPTLLALASRV